MIRPPPPFKAKCHRGELSKSAAYILLWRPTFYVGVKSCLYLILNWVYSRTEKPVSGDRNSSMISPGHSGQALTPSATVGHSFGDGVRLSSHLGNRNKLSCPRHDHRIHSGFYSPWQSSSEKRYPWVWRLFTLSIAYSLTEIRIQICQIWYLGCS